jgi:hypothetical protein
MRTMSTATARKEGYQNTTVRIPRPVYERAKTVVERHDESLNEFVVDAVVAKLHTLEEAEIDAAFAEMANDQEYQREAVALTREFEASDRGALEVADKATDEYSSGNTAKAASR